MNDEPFIIPLLTVISFAIGLVLGITMESNVNTALLKSCAKTNDVYQCEIIAVPMEKEE